MQRFKSLFGSRKNTSTEPEKPKPTKFTDRCPLNHKCIEFVEGRHTNVKEFIPKEQIDCDACQQPCGSKPSIYSCIRCDYDICSECVSNFEQIQQQKAAQTVEFKDTDGDLILMQAHDDKIVQKVNGRVSVKNLTKFSISKRMRKYTDDTGFGFVPRNVNIDELQKNVTALFELKAPKSKYPTAAHNPNWEFLQKSTIANLIVKCIGDDCSFDLACTIASFMVERQIEIRCFLYDSENSRLQSKRKITLPGNQSVLNGFKAEFGRRLEGCYIMHNELPKQQNKKKQALRMLENDNHSSYINIRNTQNIDDLFQFGLSTNMRFNNRGGGLVGDAPYSFREIEDLEKIENAEALVGDIFCWNNVVFVGTLEPEIQLQDDLDDLFEFYRDMNELASCQK